MFLWACKKEHTCSSYGLPCPWKWRNTNSYLQWSVGRVVHATKGSAGTWRPRQSIINLKRHYWMRHFPLQSNSLLVSSWSDPPVYRGHTTYICKPTKTWDTTSDRPPQVQSCCGAGSEQQLRAINVACPTVSPLCSPTHDNVRHP